MAKKTKKHFFERLSEKKWNSWKQENKKKYQIAKQLVKRQQ